MKRAALFFTTIFMVAFGQDAATAGPTFTEAGPVLVEWKYRFSDSSRDKVYGALDNWRAFYDTMDRNETLLISTFGFYSLSNSIKTTLLFKSHAALSKVIGEAKAQPSLFSDIDALRSMPTSDFYESGDIYNFGGQAGDIQDFWPWAKIRTREMTLNQFGPHVSGWLNEYESNENAMAPIIMNRVYESTLSNSDKETLLTDFMDHLNSTGKVQGELTNLICWIHEDGFTISHGFLSSFGFDLFQQEVQNFASADVFGAQVPIFTQWIGMSGDIDGLSVDGEEKYYGRPSFEPYGGDGQWLLINNEDGAFNIKGLWILVPILDFAGAIVNMAYWPDFTSGWWLIVELIQAGMGLLGLIFWVIAIAASGYGDVGDATLAIYSLFHTLGEGTIVAFTAFADYLDPAPNGDNTNAIVTYSMSGFNVFMNLVVNITFLIGMDLDDLNAGIQTSRVNFVKNFRARKARQELL